MSDLRTTLVEASQAGSLLKAVSAALSPSSDERKVLASELAALHNDQAINIVDAFAGLRNNSESDFDFFLLRRVFEDLLPQLEVPVQEVTKCIVQLYREAGFDMAAGTMLEAFQEFCSRQSTRPQEALAEIESSPDLLADLLVSTLIAGSRIDASLYLGEAVRLCQHTNVEFRRRALFALGRVNLEDISAFNDVALSTLEHAAETEMDNMALVSVVRSSVALLRDSSNQLRCETAIENAILRGDEYVLHAASEAFGFQTSALSSQLLQLLQSHLIRVDPAKKGTLDNIDYGISNLIQSSHVEIGLRFLEDMLLDHAEALSLSIFDDTVRAIRGNPILRNKVLTQWFLKGVYYLCEGLEVVVGSPAGDSPELEVDMYEMDGSNPQSFIFVARKAIGYLFLKPISAASFVVSLMRHAPTDDVVSELGSLLSNPLLINFSGKLREYVEQRAKTEVGYVKAALEKSIRSLDVYLEGLKSAGNIPALHPSEAHREAHHRQFSAIMAESFRKAESESSLLQLFPKSILLYGRKAVNYVYGPEGKSSRMEINLLSHGTEFEVPRLTTLDPCGLDFMLRVFRRERLTE